MASSILKRHLRRLGPLALALLLAGCAKDSARPLVPRPEPGFVADSPVNAVRLFEWCWDHRNLEHYGLLFADDFLFGCAATDSAGRAFIGGVLTRVDEIESTRHLFVGGAAQAPANSITLQLDPNLIPEADPRSGKNPEHHQLIVSSMVLRIDTDAEDFEITGALRFFLVRGDVALIPAELSAGGIRPDPNRWYIERWEDESMGSAAARAALLRTMPARSFTVCGLKMLYR